MACSLIIVGIGSYIDWDTFDQHLKAQEGIRDLLTFLPFKKKTSSEELLKQVKKDYLAYMEKTGGANKPIQDTKKKDSGNKGSTHQIVLL